MVLDPTMPATSEATATIVFVRHGQSSWNAVRRWQGTANPPLTELGRTQAALQAEALAAWCDRAALSLTAAWTSPLERAAATARILARGLGLDDAAHDVRLREAHAGEWEGMTPDEIVAAWPGYLESGRRPPAFERDELVRDRAWSAVTHIADAVVGSDGVALAVTHSGLLRRLSERAGFGEIAVPNLGGYRLDLRHTGEHWVADRIEVVEPIDVDHDGQRVQHHGQRGQHDGRRAERSGNVRFATD